PSTTVPVAMPASVNNGKDQQAPGVPPANASPVKVLKLHRVNGEYQRVAAVPPANPNPKAVVVRAADELASEAKRSYEVSRKRGNAETIPPKGWEAPQNAHKRPRPLEMPAEGTDMRTAFPTPDQKDDDNGAFAFDATSAKIVGASIEDDDDDIVVLKHVTPSEKSQKKHEKEKKGGGIKMELDYVTAGTELPATPPAVHESSHDEPLNVQLPMTPVSAVPLNVAMLTPESSVHTNITQEDDVTDFKPPVNPTATAHVDQFDLDERKFMDSSSTVSTSSGSGSHCSSSQGFPMPQNLLQMFAANPHDPAMFASQMMGGAQLMANPFFHAAPTASASQRPPNKLPAHDSNKEFWEMNEPGKCPICEEIITGKSLAKRNHYKKLHYALYYSKVRCTQPHPNLQQFLGISLGGENGESRMCRYCSGCFFAQGRHGMLAHLQQVHPLQFGQFCSVYLHHWFQITSEPFGVNPPDSTIHNTIMSQYARICRTSQTVTRPQ
ncbi:hypothetical protein PMAYCL1PPCAC_28245, partial [Pristionchus mayeri]